MSTTCVHCDIVINDSTIQEYYHHYGKHKFDFKNEIICVPCPVCDELNQVNMSSELIQSITVPINLVIIAKTTLYRGLCYIGYSKEHNRLYRPIDARQEEAGCWSINTDFEIGHCYGFRALVPPLEMLVPEDTTSLSHQLDDIDVLFCNSGPPFQGLFDSLKPLCKLDVNGIFLNIMEDKYLEEGTNTPSVGLLLVNENQISIGENMFDGNKKRIAVKTSDGRMMEWSYRPIQTRSIPTTAEREVIIVVGLARPWDNNGTYPRKRCYIMGLSLVYEE